MGEELVRLSDATIQAGDAAVLFGVNFSINEGDFAYIVGKVGTGKTSIFRTLIAESPLEKGEGCICGYDLRHISRKDIPYLRRRVGVVFQDFQLLMDRSVEDNLMFVLRATGWKDSKQMEEKIFYVLDLVGLAAKKSKMPHQLSGGEQQRVAIARALLNSPRLILADEPTGNLDAETAQTIMDTLTLINRETGAAIVMITHNRALCEKYPGKIFECRDESLFPIGNEEEAAL